MSATKSRARTLEVPASGPEVYEGRRGRKKCFEWALCLFFPIADPLEQSSGLSSFEFFAQLFAALLSNQRRPRPQPCWPNPLPVASHPTSSLLLLSCRAHSSEPPPPTPLTPPKWPPVDTCCSSGRAKKLPFEGYRKTALCGRRFARPLARHFELDGRLESFVQIQRFFRQSTFSRETDHNRESLFES